jgi:NitT/TauT family transport system substrate-binding protein
MTFFKRFALAAFAFGLFSAPAIAQTKPLDKVTFGTNWLPEAEHGGFYQAVADGTYAQYGLDVTIVPGGPRANNRMQLMAKKLDFYMGGNLIQPFLAVEKDIPTLVVAAIFQSDPSILMAHPNQGFEKFEDLKKAKLYLSQQSVASFFQWMKADYGFSDSQLQPYSYNPAPFLADKTSALQGYVTSDPQRIEKAAGFKPLIFRLSDAGFSSYTTTIETHRETEAQNPDLVKRFVEASLKGWKNYLHGDNAAANAVIKRENPDMNDEIIAYAIAKMKSEKIVENDETMKLGLGTMSDERMKAFYDLMVRSNLIKAGLDYKRAYSLNYVNKGLVK